MPSFCKEGKVESASTVALKSSSLSEHITDLAAKTGNANVLLGGFRDYYSRQQHTVIQMLSQRHLFLFADCKNTNSHPPLTAYFLK